MDVDGTSAARILIPPHVTEEEIAREHAAAMLNEIEQQQEFLGREPDLLPPDIDEVSLDVERQRTIAERTRSGVSLRPTQQRGDPSRQLSRAERFRDVIVSAELQARDALGFLAARGDHDHRDGGRRGIRPERLADEQTIHAGQHQVEHDRIGCRRPDLRKDGRSGRHGIDTMPRLLEIAHDQVRDIVVVLDDEHAAHERWAPCA